MELSYSCVECGKPFNFNKDGNEKDKVGYNIGENTLCVECLEKKE